MFPAPVAVLLAAAGALAGGTAGAQNVDVRSVFTRQGDDVMTDGQGRTLYTYDLDFHNVSVCTDECAVVWPPFEAGTDAFAGGAFSIVTRTDGRRMWAYLGAPLYYYSKDTHRFDTKGDGISGFWHVAKLPGDND